MTATSYQNGHKICWDEIKLEWKYKDGQDISKFRKCPKCNQLPDKNGHDNCLGELPGVDFACCGHGVEDGYIKFKNGKLIRFKNFEIELLNKKP